MSLVLERRFATRHDRPPALAYHLDGLDVALVCLFLIGLYTNYTIQISAKLPFPSAPAGVAGLCLLWRRRGDVTGNAVIGFMAVMFLYVASILCATSIEWLPRRLNGLVQLTYSLAIGYALFLTMIRANRRQAAALFLSVSLVILIGCLLENYGGLRGVSDAARKAIYSRGVYENDLRDLAFYGRIRPKFFASEPSSVTFCYTLCAFLWLVLSPWRSKFVLYLTLVCLGLFAMPGPTLLLMVLLILPFMLFLDSRRGGRLSGVRVIRVVIVAGFLVMAFVVGANLLFAERLHEIGNGNDPSFFYRVQGPALTAAYVAQHYPLAGAGLTGEPFIEPEVINLYVRSSSFSSGWEILSPATELLINYFWLHWIYLGVLWGLLVTMALALWLRVLRVPSLAFVWIVWMILGQSSGAYVGPTCWAVFFLAAAAACLQQRTAELDEAPLIAPPLPFDVRAAWLEVIAARAEHRAAERAATTAARALAPRALVCSNDPAPRIARLGLFPPAPPQASDAAE